MPDRNEWTLLERHISEELNSRNPDSSSGCLEPEQMLDLIEVPEEQPVDASKMAHVATCASCRDTYFDLRRAWQDTATLRDANAAHAAPLTTATPVQTPAVSASDNSLSTFNTFNTFNTLPMVRFLRSMFAPTFGFALGAAALYLLVIRPSAARPTDKPEHEAVAGLKRDLEARDLQIAQLSRDLSASRKETQSTIARATEATTKLKSLTRERNEREKQVEIARLDREAATSLQDAQSLALNSVDAGGTSPVVAIRGNAGSDTASHEIHLVTPPRFAVWQDRPVLECKPLPGATDYTVEIDAEDPQRRGQVPECERISGSMTKWRLKTAPKPDPVKEEVYLWSVRATRNGKDITSSSAQFIVLSQARLKQLEQDRRKYADRPLTLGVLYWRTGLLNEAERQFKLALKDPDRRPLATDLLRQLQTKKAL